MNDLNNQPMIVMNTYMTRNGYQTTPLHLHIQNINWFVTRVKFGSDQNGKIELTPYRMLSWLSFFQPRRPNLPQVGQNGYQTTPLHLHIQNIKLFCDSSQVWI